MAAQARWTNPTVARCPCCGGPVEDELHLVLECPEYTFIRNHHAALFADARGADDATMRILFQPANFAKLSAFLKDCEAHRTARLQDG